MYDGQFDLVKEHLSILENMERNSGNGERICSIDQREVFRKSGKTVENNSMNVENDEEWSTCDEEDTTIDEDM